MKSVNYMSTMCFSLFSRRGRATERPRMYAYAVSAGELQASGDDVCGEVAPNKNHYHLLFASLRLHLRRAMSK
jgi:hypothetical protein